MYMIHFTPEQYAVFVGGVRYIKKVIKKRGKGKSTINRKQKKGTRRRQKGGNKLLRTIINGLFLAALFSAYLIYTGTDMSLQTGIMAFSNATNLGVNADDINNFMEGLAIMVFYAGYNWDVAGQSRPSNCDQGMWTPYIPGYGEVSSLSTEPIPGWKENCPRTAYVLGNVLSSVLAGMFMAWVGPCIISELVESTMGPPPTPTSTSAPTTLADQPSTTSGDEAAQEVLREALMNVTVSEADAERQLQQQQQQIVVQPKSQPRGKRLLTRQEQIEKAQRSDARRLRCNFRNKDLPQMTTQDERLGNTLISLPQEVMMQLQQTGHLEAITRMISEAANQVDGSLQSEEWRGELGSMLQLNGSRLQLKDGFREIGQDLCNAPLPARSCPPIPKSTKQRTPAQQARFDTIKARMIKNPSDKGPTIEELSDSESDSDSDLTAGGAKRKQIRRRRKINKKTKKKRPRNKKKSRKRR